MGNRLVECAICGSKLGNKVCRLCGRNVCNDHFGKFVCTACKSGKF